MPCNLSFSPYYLLLICIRQNHCKIHALTTFHFENTFMSAFKSSLVSIVPKIFIKINTIFCTAVDPANFARKDTFWCKSSCQLWFNHLWLGICQCTCGPAQQDSGGATGARLACTAYGEVWEIFMPLRCWMFWKGHEAIAVTVLSPTMSRFIWYSSPLLVMGEMSAPPLSWPEQLPCFALSAWCSSFQAGSGTTFKPLLYCAFTGRQLLKKLSDTLLAPYGTCVHPLDAGLPPVWGGCYFPSFLYFSSCA